jgi:hypothetical protein
VSPVPYAKYADTVGERDCPNGYAVESGVCKRGGDEMVKVGRGMSAFWIDRYEMSVWSNAEGTGTQYGALMGDDFTAG